MGNGFLKRHKAVIDFKKWVVELDNEIKSVSVNFKRVLDSIRISGIRVVHKQVDRGDTEVRVNVYRESEERERDESEERVWENRADKFFNEGGVVGLSLIHI